MVFSQPLDEIVRQRTSVRTYADRPLSPEIKALIGGFMGSVDGPFPEKTVFRLIEAGTASDGKKLGTYGMVKGAVSFIGAGVEKGPSAELALGYNFEKLILFLKSLDLGTCWLGGTFNRGEFAKIMALPDSMLFPAISPVGYAEKKRRTESLVRSVVRADARRPWEALFYNSSFSEPLTREKAGEAAYALELLRLGPSASNKQPWRVVKAEKSYHFYEQSTPGYSSAFDFDMQAIDLGIAACHFHLAMQERGIEGKFNLRNDPKISGSAHLTYKYTWEPAV